jgi:hypothetical protein
MLMMVLRLPSRYHQTQERISLLVRWYRRSGLEELAKTTIEVQKELQSNLDCSVLALFSSDSRKATLAIETQPLKRSKSRT